MEALICPECGAKVDPPPTGIDYVKCEYCSTSFRVGETAPATNNFADSDITSPTSAASGRSGLIFIAVIILGAVIFGVTRLMSVQSKTNETINAAQDMANNARSAANAMRQAANAMANAARQVNVNSASPSSSPKPGRTPGH